MKVISKFRCFIHCFVFPFSLMPFLALFFVLQVAILQAELAKMEASATEQAEVVHQSRVVAEAREAEAASSVAALRQAQHELAQLQQQLQSQPVVVSGRSGGAEGNDQPFESSDSSSSSSGSSDQNSEALAMARVVAETHQVKAAALAQEVAALQAQVHSLKESAAAATNSISASDSEAATAAAQKKAVTLEAGNKKLIERVATPVSGLIECMHLWCTTCTFDLLGKINFSYGYLLV
jgi:septal ring factor EnvC (AmiA/AmiB activator)